MALVNRNNRQVQIAVGGVLYGVASRVGQEAYEHLRDGITAIIQRGGGDVYEQVQQFAQQWATTVRGRARGEMQAIGDMVTNTMGRAMQEGGRLAEYVQEFITGPDGDIEPIDQGTPDLSDLIPENDGNNARVGDRRNIDGEPVNRRPGDMAGSGSGDVEMEAGRLMAGGNNQVSKETPISSYPSLSYGLPETHTTILPWTGWLTVSLGTLPAAKTPVQLKMRLNCPFDMLDVATQTSPAVGGTMSTAGFYAVPANTSGLVAVSTYPEQFASNTTSADERPAWRDYWCKQYDFYTVLGCEYEIIIRNPLQAAEHAMLIGTQIDTYSDTATTTGNVMPLTRLSEVMAFKNIQWYNLRCNDSAETERGNVVVIKGRYTPGQAKRNIINDGDVKTWTPTSGASVIPNLKEIMTVNFWDHPLNGASGNIPCSANKL